MIGKTKRAYVDELYYDLSWQDTNLKFAWTWNGGDDEIHWSKHRTYLEIQENDYYVKKVSHHSIIRTIVVLDFDPLKNESEHQLKKRVDLAETYFKKEGVSYYIYSTGSRGFHLHCFFPAMRFWSKVRRENFRSNLIAEFQCDQMKSRENVMIAMPGVEHWKSGKIKEMIRHYETK